MAQPPTMEGHLDTYLADLDDLGGSSGEEEAVDGQDVGDGDVMEDAESEEEPTSHLKHDDISTIVKVYGSTRLTEFLSRIDEALARTGEKTEGSLEMNPEYRLIVDSNGFIRDVDTEILGLHKFVRDRYAAKFPELESLVPNPMDYIRVANRIGNETDLTLVELGDILPTHTVMVVTVTGSTSVGEPLAASDLSKVTEACNVAMVLDEARSRTLQFVESRMTSLLPNVSTLVGSAIAARLLTTAGGIRQLAEVPSCNLERLGAKKRTKGYTTSTKQGTGFLMTCDLITSTPPVLRHKVAKLVAGKVSLASRVDSNQTDAMGTVGKAFRDEIEKKIEKLQEPPPARLPKPLPAPKDNAKKKRGGRRIRKMKERFAMTDMRKQANRLAMDPNQPEETYGLSSKGLGMLGAAGSGKMRLVVEKKRGLLKGPKVQKNVRHYGGSSGATSGISSSLAFTPVQGLELENPDARAAKLKELNEKYFNPTGGFVNLRRKEEAPPPSE
eukprot:TRINITY_DN15083_c0_g1_i1.p1 TRINITY_DN15083_c0_g1~~TRINITY_DN15083_c0_g1_i1.p1  ORF type:complete len:499 (-),score=132.99 TRINITY_DN15083_c0_g1_i1:396-1892(-)